MLVFTERQDVTGTNSEISNFTKEFAFETDTSQVGLGAMLTQEYAIEGKKSIMPVLYASRILKELRDNIA